MNRLSHLARFYSLLDLLESTTRGKRLLGKCSALMDWPQRGVYFFFEPGEARAHTGTDLRVVRVGTHAITEKSRTTLWNRLSQHRGTLKDGGGNHRGSIFRLLVGTAIDDPPPSWDNHANTASAAIRAGEIDHERKVSTIIRAMPFLWLAVEDKPGQTSLRSVIERNAIALLSNYERTGIDLPSSQWLGHACKRKKVRHSGLWNQDHVNEEYDPGFLDVFEQLIDKERK